MGDGEGEGALEQTGKYDTAGSLWKPYQVSNVLRS